MDELDPLNMKSLVDALSQKGSSRFPNDPEFEKRVKEAEERVFRQRQERIDAMPPSGFNPNFPPIDYSWEYVKKRFDKK